MPKIQKKLASLVFNCIKSIKIYINRTSRLFKNQQGESLETASRECALGNNHVFFGYYDKTPFSKDGNLILANVVAGKNEPPKKGQEMSVGYFKKGSDKFNKIGSTTTWCWQQGCRLQWFAGKEGHVIYNKLIGKENGSVVQDVKSGNIIKELNFPIYDVNPGGKTALTLNFSRLHRLRPGYGYVEIEDQTKNQKIPEKDGIWLCDFEENEKRLLISLEEIMAIEKVESMDGAEHYVNFISYCNDGRMFAFLHVWERENAPRGVRLMISDESKTSLYSLPTKMRISHYSWIGNEKIVFTAKNEKGVVNYYLYELKNGNIEKFGADKLAMDGHPSIFQDSAWMITDTPPDKYGEQALLLYNLENNKLKQLFRGEVPSNYTGELRCDFHPRWDQQGNCVAIDFPAKKHRIMKVFEVE